MAVLAADVHAAEADGGLRTGAHGVREHERPGQLEIGGVGGRQTCHRGGHVTGVVVTPTDGGRWAANVRRADFGAADGSRKAIDGMRVVAPAGEIFDHLDALGG